MSRPLTTGAHRLSTAAPSFASALAFWFKLGWISFGGPAGQIAIMHGELVERRRWIDEPRFLRGLDFCMLLPGPEAMQLATWLGWRLHGLRGGFAAGILFVLPSALLLVLLGWLYLRFAALPALQPVLLGLQAAVLGIVMVALLRIGRRILKTPAALLIAAAALVAMASSALPFPALIAAAAAAGLLLGRLHPSAWPPAMLHTTASPAAVPVRESPRRALALALLLLAVWWLPLLALGALVGTDSTAFAQGLFFSKAAVVTFGGAYAVLPYVAQHAVEAQQWLGAEQMLVGLGLAETTPGPLIIVLEFVGFVGGWQQPDLASPLASALLCAAVTLWATFVPCFLFVLPAAPWIERIGEWRAAAAAFAAVTAAVVGVIANLALWFGRHLFAGLAAGEGAFALLVAAAAAAAMLRGLALPWIVVAAALAGALAGAL